MGSKVSAPVPQNNGTEASLTTNQLNSNNQPTTSARSNSNSTSNTLIDTANRMNQHANANHSGGNSALASTLASHPAAAAILMRTYNPSQGFASILASSSGLESAVVSHSSHPSSIYPYEAAFGPRGYNQPYIGHLQNGKTLFNAIVNLSYFKKLCAII